MPRIHPLLQAVIALVIGLAVAGVTYLLVADAEEEYEARARGALTEEVQWPFFDAVRETQAIRLEDPQVQAAIDEAAGEPVSVSVELPRSQVFIDVTVVASTATAAAVGADTALDVIVVADTEEIIAAAREELDLATASLAAVGTPETDAERSEADRLVRLITDYELDLASVEARIRVLQPAEVPTDPTRDPARLAAIAGLIAAFLGFVLLRWLSPADQDTAAPAQDQLTIDPDEATATRSLAEREQATAGRSS
ncbi:MAG: hypothetical protein ACR2QE_08660 [Acidimicrobiales bacterium]